MKRKKINRIAHRAHTKLLGGKQKADRLRCDAADLRIQHGLCRCGDQEKFYPNQNEADADKTPNAICEECGKPKLRVVVIGDKPLPERDQIAAHTALTDLLR
jgi:hypothetical protein